MSSGRCLVVMYHYVRNRAGTPESAIRGLDVRAFEAQLDLLCELMTPIDWPTFLVWRTGRCCIPQQSVLLTFDDGLADHAQVVFPILESRALRGLFFVQTSVLTGGAMDAAHQIHLLMCRLGVAGLAEAVRAWLEAREPDARQRFPVEPGEARRIYHYESAECAALKYLLTHVLPVDLRDRLVTDLFARHVGDPQTHAARWYARWDQLGEMQEAGHSIGGHGGHHLPYHRLSPAEQAGDMAECSAVLAERLGTRPRPFSYPYGSCNDDIARRCAFSGFVNGFTTEQGWIGASDDAHRLRRVDTIHVGAFLEREFACTLQ